jgi:hypothetical protein
MAGLCCGHRDEPPKALHYFLSSCLIVSVNTTCMIRHALACCVPMNSAALPRAHCQLDCPRWGSFTCWSRCLRLPPCCDLHRERGQRTAIWSGAARNDGGDCLLTKDMDGSLVLSGDETALRYRYDEAEMVVPSRPATVLCTRQGATELQQQQQALRDARERAQPTQPDLFCSGRTWRRRRWTSRRCSSRRGWTTLAVEL